MRLPFLEFVKRRFHYELDKAQEEYNRALGRMEDGEFERGFIAGLERGLYLIEDSKESWGYNPLDDIPKPDDDTTDEDDTDDSGSTEGSGEGSGEGTDSEDGGSGSGSEGSSGGSGDGSSGDGDDPKLDLPLDAMTQ